MFQVTTGPDNEQIYRCQEDQVNEFLYRFGSTEWIYTYTDLNRVNGLAYNLMSRERIYRPIWKK